MIHADNLSFRYPGQDCEALVGLSLATRPGEVCLVSGPTGCGKSTLGLACCGAIPHVIPGRRSGGLMVNSRDPGSRPMRDTSRDLGFLLQNVETMIFTDRVEQEVAFGLENFGVPPKDMDELIDRALSLVGASHMRGRMLATLSAGERQRVLLAALLALDQRVLVLDEPLAFLDRQAQGALLSLLGELAKAGRCVVVFEHRRDVVRPAASREIYLRGGCVADAAPDALAAFPVMQDANPGETVLAFDGVSLAWPGQENSLVSGLSFAVRAGESVALLGDNGSGKTTLLRMAMGLLRPTGGSISTCGLSPTREKPAVIARRAALLFQQPDHQLYLTTVADEAGRRNGCPDTAAKELARMGLADLAQRHPRSLSMGQKRRLTIAAALARKPDILLLDEPSVGQDDQSLALVLARLSEYVAEGGAILATTHDARVAKALAHRSVVLEKPGG
ncbi:MAG: ABC transporter ATP-binding protein [Desulfatibacillaceae bacterium]